MKYEKSETGPVDGAIKHYCSDYCYVMGASALYAISVDGYAVLQDTELVLRNLVAVERQRQIEKGYDATHDKAHTPREWLAHIHEYTLRAAKSGSPDDKIKVAALVLAWLEVEK